MLSRLFSLQKKSAINNYEKSKADSEKAVVSQKSNTVYTSCTFLHRTRFYLCYRSDREYVGVSRLLYINAKFLNYIKLDSQEFILRLRECPVDELYLITPEYLTPYLNYIKENKRLFRAAIENATTLRLNEIYDKMFAYVFTPILERFRVPEQQRKYIMSFYIRGLIAIITEWVNQDCTDSVEYMTSLIQECVMHHKYNDEGV